MGSEQAGADFAEVATLLTDDLSSLIELVFPNGPVKLRHVRQASVIVRRWLCDNELAHFARHIRQPITFPVMDDADILKEVSRDENIDYYASAGIKFNGRPVMAMYHSQSESTPAWLSKLSTVGFHDVKLSQALDKRVLYHKGNWYKMGDVVRFACNKLGGAHLDYRRNDRDMRLIEASRFMTFGGWPEKITGGEMGEVHLALEPEGTEAISGVNVAVIVAATMLVNVNIGGEPIVSWAMNVSGHHR